MGLLSSIMGKYVVLVILIMITLSSMVWTFSATDPLTNKAYKSRNVQLSMNLLHMLLFVWMLISVLYTFRRVYEKNKNLA